MIRNLALVLLVILHCRVLKNEVELWATSWAQVALDVIDVYPLVSI